MESKAYANVDPEKIAEVGKNELKRVIKKKLGVVQLQGTKKRNNPELN